jgi:hypothetical protein
VSASIQLERWEPGQPLDPVKAYAFYCLHCDRLLYGAQGGVLYESDCSACGAKNYLEVRRGLARYELPPGRACGCAKCTRDVGIRPEMPLMAAAGEAT